MKTEKQVVAELKKRCDRDGQTKTAKELGYKPQYINDVINERSSISPRLADALGYELIVEKKIVRKFRRKA